MLGATYGGHLFTGPARLISEQPGNPIVKHWGTSADYSDEFYLAKGVGYPQPADHDVRGDPVVARLERSTSAAAREALARLAAQEVRRIERLDECNRTITTA